MEHAICDANLSFQCTFASLPGSANSVVEDVLTAMRRFDWSDQDIFAVELSLVEAITNAMEHGNHYDPNKSVFVSATVCQDNIDLLVRDEGFGFERNIVPDPRLEERHAVPSGRGVFLIVNFMSRVSFNERGNELSMNKTRSRAA